MLFKRTTVPPRSAGERPPKFGRGSLSCRPGVCVRRAWAFDFVRLPWLRSWSSSWCPSSPVAPRARLVDRYRLPTTRVHPESKGPEVGQEPTRPLHRRMAPILLSTTSTAHPAALPSAPGRGYRAPWSRPSMEEARPMRRARRLLQASRGSPKATIRRATGAAQPSGGISTDSQADSAAERTVARAAITARATRTAR
jgi:hypothetical protein